MSGYTGTKVQVSFLSGCLHTFNRLCCTLVIIAPNNVPKLGYVLSIPCGVYSEKSGSGTGVGIRGNCGQSKKKSDKLFLDSISAEQFLTPLYVQNVKNAMKKEKVQSRCITTVSLAFPFLMDGTTCMLSHWTSILCLASSWPHTAQLITIAANSLAIILVTFQFF